VSIGSQESMRHTPDAMKRLILSITAIAIFIFFPQALNAERISPNETKQIEALIASFIRNGRVYNSATAAEFLRRKWRQQEDRILSAEDFIEKIASFSSTTGRPYLIRFGDGREIPCADALRGELHKLRNNRQ
jgi:hypothetical protein